MSTSLSASRRVVGALLAAGCVVAMAAAPAAACAGLVGENGTIKLVRTTTLAAYHDGVERYVTSFQFTGEGKEVGSIVPLPGVPSAVTRGGDWTLQRLEREVAPPVAEPQFDASRQAAASGAAVLLQTKIDALDITILRGGGNAVGAWAVDHGFLLTPDAPKVLDFYSRRSPVFMAARFDASRAAALGQHAGDGTPIMLTIPLEEPWVPLRILALGRQRSEVVDADVFLLTDTRPKLLAGGTGLRLDRDEPASAQLLADLRSDKGMSWVPAQMWFTSLELSTPAGNLTYDLAAAVRPNALPSLRDAGVDAAHARPVDTDRERALWPFGAALALGLATFAIVAVASRRRPTLGAAA